MAQTPWRRASFKLLSKELTFLGSVEQHGGSVACWGCVGLTALGRSTIPVPVKRLHLVRAAAGQARTLELLSKLHAAEKGSGSV